MTKTIWKSKQLPFILILAAASLGGFVEFSSLEIPFFLKSWVALVPLQVLAFAYVFYWRYRNSGARSRR